MDWPNIYYIVCLCVQWGWRSTLGPTRLCGTRTKSPTITCTAVRTETHLRNVTLRSIRKSLITRQLSYDIYQYYSVADWSLPLFAQVSGRRPFCATSASPSCSPPSRSFACASTTTLSAVVCLKSKGQANREAESKVMMMMMLLLTLLLSLLMMLIMMMMLTLIMMMSTMMMMVMMKEMLCIFVLPVLALHRV